MISIKQIFMACAFLCSAFVSAQVGIGTTTPNASAVLDVTSTTSGLLPPRMSNVQKLVIPSPVAGLLVWCSDCGSNGEMQVYNGNTWTNMAGNTASGQVPTITSTTAATLIITGTSAGLSATSGGVISSAGDASITERGVCWSSTPLPTILNTKVIAAGTTTGAFTATITGLPAGTTYYVRAFATSSSGTAYGNQVSFVNCGAWVSQWAWKQFMCHNMGADTTLDPNVPVQGIHGDYYQWGSSTPAATSSTSSAAISGWNTAPNADTSWENSYQGTNDPCPAGYCVASYSTLNYMIGTINQLNIVTRTGTWGNNPSNFGVAVHFGPNTSVKTLTFPVAGYRIDTSGSLGVRGAQGMYWSGLKNSGNANMFLFFDSSLTRGAYARMDAASVRCEKI